MQPSVSRRHAGINQMYQKKLPKDFRFLLIFPEVRAEIDFSFYVCTVVMDPILVLFFFTRDKTGLKSSGFDD